MEQAAARGPRPLRKALKYTLLTLAAAALILGALVVYVAATFDPRDLHPRAIDLVSEKTGRTLEIRGETALSFWPDVGVRLNDLSLTDRGSSEIFATLESARVTLKLVPLLRREIVATELAITGAQLRITRDAQRRLNIADLLEGEGQPPRFDIGRIAIERSTLTYRDLAAGTRYELGSIALEAGRLAPGIETPLALETLLTDGTGRPGLRLKVKTRLVPDRDTPRYALGETQVEARGTHGEEAIAATLAASRVHFVPAPLTAESVRVTLDAKGPAGTTGAKLELARIEASGERIEAPTAALALTLERGGHRMLATASSAFEADLATRAVNLAGIDVGFTAFGPRLPRKGLAGTLQGEARIDIGKEDLHTRVSGTVGESKVKAQISATGFASPVYAFDVALDRLALDRYIAAEPGAQKSTRAGRAEDLLQMLEGLPASGTLAIGVFESAGAKATNVKLALR